MKYSTNDLSRILDVSTNTVRRFEEKGYLGSERNEQNGYRQFNHLDVEKLMYVNKYRKVGFGHDDIAEIFQHDISYTLQKFQGKMEELDRQIAYYTGLRHLLKDDIVLMRRIEEYGSGMIEMECSPMHYVLYQTRGKLSTGGQDGDALHRFMSACPEFEYIYLFEKEDVEARNFVYSEGVAANHIITRKYEVDITPPVMSYERHSSILRFTRLPFDFMDENRISREELRQVLFDDFFNYMEEHGLCLAGDVFGLKIGFSREGGQEWQYVLMHFPVDRME